MFTNCLLLKRTACLAVESLMYILLTALIVFGISAESDAGVLFDVKAEIVSKTEFNVHIYLGSQYRVDSLTHNTGSDVWQISLTPNNQTSDLTFRRQFQSGPEEKQFVTKESQPLIKAILDPDFQESFRLFLYFSRPVHIKNVGNGNTPNGISLYLSSDTQEVESTQKSPKKTDKQLWLAMRRANDSMRLRKYNQAINIYTAILEEPKNQYSQEALELLGFARELNSQRAHAHVEYERYLSLYPQGLGADRIRQRLAGLLTATQQPKKKLKSARSRKTDNAWQTFGTLGSRFQLIQSSGSGLASEISQSDFVNSLYYSGKHQGTKSSSEFRLSFDHISDILEDGDEDETKISYAYFDHSLTSGPGIRVGRQKHHPSGVSYRFDGILLSYKQNSKIRYNLVYGAPVERSSNSYIHKDKLFYGLNTQLSNYFDYWSFGFYLINQEVNGITDRQAVGSEIKYINSNRAVYSVIDYDLLFDELNSWYLVGNLFTENGSTLYLNLNYRFEPWLTTSNALIGQSVTSLDELSVSMEEDQIQQLAIDRSARSGSIELGGSKPWNKKLTLSGGLSFSELSDTKSTADVPATPDQSYYSIYSQLIQEGVFKDNDVGTLGLRFSESDTTETISLSASDRFTIKSGLRLTARIRASNRHSTETHSNRIALEPNLKLEYKLSKALQIESELGILYYQEKFNQVKGSSQDYLMSISAYWNF